MTAAHGQPGLRAASPQAGPGLAASPGPVVVALGPGASAERVVRRAAELATLRRAPLVGVQVRDTSGIGIARSRGARSMERVLGDFGGRLVEVGGTDIALELARFAEREHAAVLVVGDTSRSRGRRLVHGSVARRTLRLIGPVEVYVVPPDAHRRGGPHGAAARTATNERVPWPLPRLFAWVLAGRARQTARSRAEADRLGRLVACGVAEPTKPPAELAAGLRAAFALDATAILSCGAEGWRVVAAAGEPVPGHPYGGQFAVEIGPGRVLVLSGAALTAGGASALRVFTGELLLARHRSQLAALNSATASPHAEARSGTRDRWAGWPEGRKRTPHPGTVMK
jgi:nucleotide-binding universal stress UspA family protein